MPAFNTSAGSADLSAAKRLLLAQRLRGKAVRVAEAAIPARTPGSPLHLSPCQQSLWLQSALDPDLPTYNEAVTVRVRGPLDADLLQQSLSLFVDRQEIWRTGFHTECEDVVQRVLPELTVPLAVADLQHLSPNEREAASNDLARQQALPPFRLSSPPLLRATLVHMAPDDSRLHLTLAHIVFDGFSLREVFLPELRALYTALASGQAPTLPPVSIQYADFAQWRRAEREAPALEASLRYWKQHLSGDLPLLRLPTDRPRPRHLSRRGNLQTFALPAETVDALRHLAQVHGASLYLVLLASLKALLFRYSGHEDLILGTVADGRRRPELQRMLGYALEVFPLRTRPAANLPFTAFLQHVRTVFLDSFAACDVPFDRIVAALGTPRDTAHQPLFQTMFAFQPAVAEPDADWTVAGTDITTGTAKFDLYLEADEHARGIAVRIFYSTDLFDAPTIQRLTGHWKTLLDGICDRPATPLGDLPLLTSDEHTLLQTWNATTTAIPHTTLHDLVYAQAARTPDNTAVTFQGAAWTYAQLTAEADRIAAALQHAGAGPGTLVALLLERSPLLLASLLGILRTGAAYVPLDPASPPARIALCMQDAAPALLLTERQHAEKASGIPTLLLEDLPPATLAPISAQPEDLAYVLHTSGSTGRPKGVEIRHRSVVNFLLSMQREPGFTARDTLVALTTVSFDIAVLELFLPLLTGGRIALASRADALDPSRLAALVQQSGCTVLQATPSTWSALLTNGWPGQPGLRALCGGEALSRALARRLLALGLELWNVYGPTETTVWSTLHRVQPEDTTEDTEGSVPIGKPLRNTTAYVLDDHLHPLPANVPGELYLGGAGVAAGYRNGPELTEQRFIQAQGERLYRTGDCALFRPDGTLEVLGRADNQVKIRGHRVELEEVETNLAAHPGIAAAAARAWPDSTGGHRLAAYLVPVAAPLEPQHIRAFLRDRLPEYMLPSDLVVLDRLPLTGSGKLDRNRLPQPAAAETAAPQEPPANPTEHRLAHLWAATLGLPAVGRTENFFDLGGHSLLLVKLLLAVNREFGTALDLARLMGALTVQRLARVLTGQDAPETGTLVTLNPHGTAAPLFLVHSHLLYGRLPAALGVDQPIYGLKELPPTPEDGPDFLHRLLDEHVRQIRALQPHGPYRIAGWCFAGFMAYEVARRLEAAGEIVSSLLLLDSWCPHTPARGDRTNRHAPNPPAQPANSIPHTLTFQRILDVLHHCRTEVPLRLRRGARSLAFRVCTALRLCRPAALSTVQVLGYEWMRQYRTEPYRGDLTLVRAQADNTGTPTNCGWDHLTSGNIRTVFVPGDRISMFLDPNLQQLAQTVRQILRTDAEYSPASPHFAGPAKPKRKRAMAIAHA